MKSIDSLLNDAYLLREYPGIIDVCSAVQRKLPIDEFEIKSISQYLNMLKEGHQGAVNIYNFTYRSIFERTSQI